MYINDTVPLWKWNLVFALQRYETHQERTRMKNVDNFLVVRAISRLDFSAGKKSIASNNCLLFNYWSPHVKWYSYFNCISFFSTKNFFFQSPSRAFPCYAVQIEYSTIFPPTKRSRRLALLSQQSPSPMSHRVYQNKHETKRPPWIATKHQKFDPHHRAVARFYSPLITN